MAYCRYYVYREIVSEPPPAVESMRYGSCELAGAVSATDRQAAGWLAADRYPCHPWEALRLVKPRKGRAARVADKMEQTDLRRLIEFERLMEAICDGRVLV